MKHFPNPKGTLTAILAMVMLASFASCTGKTPASDTDATDASVSTTTEITTAEITTVAETAYIDTLEKRDMGGREIIFYGQNSDDRQNFYMEEKGSELVNDTLHMRDIAVEEHLNVTLTFISESDRSVVKDNVKNSILAGNEEYNVILTSISDGMNTLPTSGVLYDMRQIPHLTLDSEYRRDAAAGLGTLPPENYSPDNDPSKEPVITWRAHGSLLFINWLNYFVYQSTPYDLKDIKDAGKEE